MNMDAKDILGLPRTPMSITQKKKSRPQKDSQRKPSEISCKVYALTGGLALLMPSIDVSQLKKCPSSGEKVNLKPQMPTKIVCAVHLQEILTHLNLQEQLQYKEAEGSSFLEGSYGNMPGTLPKQSNRGADQEEQVLMSFD